MLPQERLQKTVLRLKLTMQSGKCMSKQTEGSAIVMGETTENMGSLKKTENIKKYSYLKNM